MSVNKGGAPKGNQNARKASEWRYALKHALDNFENNSINRGQALREIANQLISKALAGDMQAIKEIGDRLDGKATKIIDTYQDDRPVEELSDEELYAIIREGK